MKQKPPPKSRLNGRTITIEINCAREFFTRDVRYRHQANTDVKTIKFYRCNSNSANNFCSYTVKLLIVQTMDHSYVIKTIEHSCKKKHNIKFLCKNVIYKNSETIKNKNDEI